MRLIYLFLLFTDVLLLNPPDFGKEMKKEFQLKDNIFYLNHGSYGASPKIVVNEKKRKIEEMEENPLNFMIQVRKEMNENLLELSKFLNVSSQDIVIVESSTNAANTILRSLNFQKGDKIMYLNIEYGMIKKIVEFLKDFYFIEIIECKINFPTNSFELLKSVENCFATNLNIKLFIFDHISSFPTLILPIKELINLSRKFNSLSLVDGAHAVGHLNVQILDLNPDFYFSSLHKWLCASKGSAFLYVKKDFQKFIHPTVISHWYKTGFQNEFRFIGSRDYSSFLTIKDTLKFRDWIGNEKIYDYTSRLCQKFILFIQKRWKIQLNVPLNMIHSMVDIPIPCNLHHML